MKKIITLICMLILVSSCFHENGKNTGQDDKNTNNTSEQGDVDGFISNSAEGKELSESGSTVEGGAIKTSKTLSDEGVL